MKQISRNDELVPVVDVARAVKHELHHIWFVQIPSGVGSDSVEVALPKWTNNGLDATIARWVTEREKWDAEIAARAKAGKTLPPTQQALHNTFIANSERRHVDEFRWQCTISSLCICHTEVRHIDSSIICYACLAHSSLV